MLNKKYREQDWNNVGYETATVNKREIVKHSAVDFYDEVEDLRGQQPFDKQSPAYEQWKRHFKYKLRYFNAIVGYNAFKFI